MKLEHRTKWVEALRSDEYLQGMGFLKVKRADGKCYYCCLGVLCEVLKPELMISEESEVAESDNGASVIYRLDGSNGILHKPLRTHTGLRLATHNALTELNDTYGKTFAEIADWIEENIEATSEEEAGTSETA